MACRMIVFILALASMMPAQRRVDPRFTYSRVICVVPFTGSGTAADPKRPEYAPWPVAQIPSGIIAFSWVPSDDGQHAIVEFVANNRSAFQAIFNDQTITVFEKGRATKAAIEAALQQYRKSFNLDQFGTVMP